MFQPQFTGKVIDGSKIHTIRKQRKRPIRVGEHISLRTWTGKPYRSKQKVLREEICLSIDAITISPKEIYLTRDDFDPEELARHDGFSSYQEMLKWFENTHGLPFEGVLIQWSPSDSNEKGRGV